MKIDTQGMSGKGGMQFCKPASKPGPFKPVKLSIFSPEEIAELRVGLGLNKEFIHPWYTQDNLG